MSDFKQSKYYQAIKTVNPVWNRLIRLQEIYPEHSKTLLHAGPAFSDFKEIPEAVKNSLAIACIYEGWAKDRTEALDLIASNDVKIRPAQDLDVVVPLAGVVSPSMYVMQIENSVRPLDKTYAVLNEGMTWCTRLGIFDEHIVDHLKWLNGEFSSWLKKVICSKPLVLSSILQQSLTLGDDGHGRTNAGSKLISDQLFQQSEQINLAYSEQIYNFLKESLAFALNIWMGASLLILKTGQGCTVQELVVKAGGNGVEFGYALSSRPDKWITVKAPEIRGNKEEKFREQDALGTIGDSAVVDVLGLGGQILDVAEMSANNLKAFLPDDYATRMNEFNLMPLDFLGQRRGLVDIQKIQLAKKAPLVLLGMISDSGQHGRIGGGVATLTSDMFEPQEVSNV